MEKKLTYFTGLSFAIGSIIGSGILFLPSLTYQLSGTNVIVSWVVATLFCLPLLMIFSDFVRMRPDSRGVEGFISLGLGETIGATVPALLLSTVVIGMPSAAIIAGKYVERIIGFEHTVVITAVLIICVGIMVNLLGIKLGGLINTIIAIGLLIVASVVIALTLPRIDGSYSGLPSEFNLNATSKGIVVAFWAFAGFENLTFIAKDFKNPQKIFLRTMASALIVCGALYLLLTYSVASLIPFEKVDSIVGVFQLTQLKGSAELLPIAVVLFSVFAVSINKISWIWGLSRMIQSSASEGKLPEWFLKSNKNGIPHRAIVFLFVAFISSVFLALWKKEWFETLLQIVSANFVVIYIMCILSYLRVCSEKLKLFLTFVLLGLFLWVLSSMGWILLYPCVVCLISSFLYLRNTKKRKTIVALNKGVTGDVN